MLYPTVAQHYPITVSAKMYYPSLERQHIAKCYTEPATEAHTAFPFVKIT